MCEEVTMNTAELREVARQDGLHALTLFNKWRAARPFLWVSPQALLFDILNAFLRYLYYGGKVKDAHKTLSQIFALLNDPPPHSPPPVCSGGVLFSTFLIKEKAPERSRAKC